MTKRFEIDVEGITQENALFKGDEFICYVDDIETIIKKLNELNEENEQLISMNNDLAKAVFKDIEFTEEDFQQAWEEYKEELKNKPFSELFKEMIGGKKND